MKSREVALLVCAFSFPQFVGAQAATDLNCTQCVGSSDIANDSVGSAKIKNKSITSTDIAAGAVKSGIINNDAVTHQKLSPGVREKLDGAIAGVAAYYDAVDDYSVAVAHCAENTIAFAANCYCIPLSEENNVGVLLACAVQGNGGLAACLPDANTYDPDKTAPVATAGVSCLAATSADGTPFIPAPTGLVPFNAERDASQDSVLQIAQWQKQQHKELEAAVAKYKEFIATYTSRIRK